MGTERAFKINQPFAVSEIIDGEAVIMNLKSGHYYSARHTGSLLWRWIEQGVSQSGMVASLVDACSDDPAEIASTVAAFLDQLIAQDLIVEIPLDASTPMPTPAASTTGGCGSGKPAFTPPVLEVYADMRDLLLLDPIHDVAETGWPMPKPAESGPD